MARENEKKNVSIESTRRTLLKTLSKKCRKEEIVDRKIPFSNNDVPAYLKWLKNFEQESRKTRIVVS